MFKFLGELLSVYLTIAFFYACLHAVVTHLVYWMESRLAYWQDPSQLRPPALTVLRNASIEILCNFTRFILLPFASFRANPLQDLGGLKVTTVEDYLFSTCTESDGNVTSINLPKSNVIKYYFEDGTWVCLRPSGTEPKVKFYFSVFSSSLEESKQKLAKTESEFMELVQQKIADLK